MLRKIEFAGLMGAECINTRSGSPTRSEQFFRNVRIAADAAARWNVQLNLETYGDLVDLASRCGELFRRPELRGVGLNYDPGNIFRFARGKVCIEEDLARAQVRPVYFHLKDASLRDGRIWNEPIGRGELNYPAIFRQLETLCPEPLAAGLELPMGFCVRSEDFSLEFLETDAAALERAIRQSLDYLSQYADVSMQ